MMPAAKLARVPCRARPTANPAAAKTATKLAVSTPTVSRPAKIASRKMA
jgi:hypothetical protein